MGTRSHICEGMLFKHTRLKPSGCMLSWRTRSKQNSCMLCKRTRLKPSGCMLSWRTRSKQNSCTLCKHTRSKPNSCMLCKCTRSKPSGCTLFWRTRSSCTQSRKNGGTLPKRRRTRSKQNSCAYTLCTRSTLYSKYLPSHVCKLSTEKRCANITYLSTEDGLSVCFNTEINLTINRRNTTYFHTKKHSCHICKYQRDQEQSRIPAIFIPFSKKQTCAQMFLKRNQNTCVETFLYPLLKLCLCT